MGEDKKKKPFYKKWWIWVILIIIIIGILFAIMYNNKNSKTSSSNSSTSSNSKAPSIDELMLPEFNQSGTAQEKVLYDKNNVKITFKGITYSSYSADVNLEFENNNSEKLRFVSGSLGCSKNAVNEFMVQEGYVNVEVDAGQNEEETFSINYEDLRIYGVDEIAEIAITFDISALDYKSKFTEIYTEPLIIDTSLYSSYDFNKDSRFIDRVTSNGIKTKYDIKLIQKDTTVSTILDKLDIDSMVVMQNKDNEYIMMMETKNNCGKDIKLSVSDVKFNDTPIYDSTWSSDDIINGKKAILDLKINSLMDEDEAKGIENIDKISFTINVLDSKSQKITSKDISYTISPSIKVESEK